MVFDQTVIDAACERIAQQPVDHPLFMTVGLYGPHSPFVCEPSKFAYYYDKLPRIAPADIGEDLHPAIKAYYEQMRMVDPDEEAMHRARAAYYGAVETLDGYVGTLRAAAEQAFGDNVIFVYGSDHGDMAGSHGTFWKQLFYEGAVRVPLMFAGAGIPAGHRVPEATSLMDLGVTLISIAGGDPMVETDGEDLWPVLQGRNGRSRANRRQPIGQS